MARSAVTKRSRTGDFAVCFQVADVVISTFSPRTGR
jgi:hypothetical protein